MRKKEYRNKENENGRRFPMGKLIFIAAVIFVPISLTACGSIWGGSEEQAVVDQTVSEATGSETKAETETETAAAPVTESTSSEQVSQETGKTGAPTSLKYIDAWQERHTMEVDPSVAGTVYDKSHFVPDERNDQWITYSDPEYQVLQGIDVSYHQGEIDWKAVADEGYEFAFIRLGFRGYGEEGVLQEDKLAVQNLQGAKDAGLKVGGYFFSQALSEQEAVEEARLAIAVAEKAGVSLELPMVYDPEIIRDEPGRANDITKEQVALNTEAFRKTVEAESDYEVDIYSNLPWEDKLFDAETLNKFDIWYADYEKQPQTPYHFTWWQYSEKGKVAGIDGEVDLNMWIIPKSNT